MIEERIETVCTKEKLAEVLKAIKKVHPYEEIAFDVYPLVIDPAKISKNEFLR